MMNVCVLPVQNSFKDESEICKLRTGGLPAPNKVLPHTPVDSVAPEATEVATGRKPVYSPQTGNTK